MLKIQELELTGVCGAYTCTHASYLVIGTSTELGGDAGPLETAVYQADDHPFRHGGRGRQDGAARGQARDGESVSWREALGEEILDRLPQLGEKRGLPSRLDRSRLRRWRWVGLGILVMVPAVTAGSRIGAGLRLERIIAAASPVDAVVRRLVIAMMLVPHVFVRPGLGHN